MKVKDKEKTKTKKKRGRPVSNVIKPIDATPEDIAKAVCLDADKKLNKKKRIKD